MRREVRMEDISDGRLYRSEDMVRAGCGDCRGCSACCRHMGNSIIVDPLDVYRLNIEGKVELNELFSRYLEFHVEDGIILPNLKMTGPEEACGFLDQDGRCSVHAVRPGLCRLFPLGRFYENGGFQYFLQTGECKKANRTKVKVSRFIDVPDIRTYEAYVSDWHFFLLDAQDHVRRCRDENEAKRVNMTLLNMFFLTPYDGGREFYGQFYERFQTMAPVREEWNREGKSL